jgi:hypothetical protein
MRRRAGMCVAILIVFATAASANAQVTSLLVGSGQSGFVGIDAYQAGNGVFQGTFVSGTGAPFTSFKYGGPSNNLFVWQGDNILQRDGHSGNPIDVFTTLLHGGNFAFGPDNNMYRIEPFSTTQNYPATIGKYDGATGARLGTFVSSSVSGITTPANMRFGPNGNLFVDNGNTILQFNGTTGAPMGAFFTAGTGGIGFVADAVFASNGNLLVSGSNGSTNDTLWRFDGTTGAYLGLFASGNGLNAPVGITQGPDGAIYVASEFSDQIKRFDLSTGNFIGDFIPSTTHQFPSYLAFTPYPVPEPTSLSLCCLAVGVGGAIRLRRRFRRVDNDVRLGCFSETGDKAHHA